LEVVGLSNWFVIHNLKAYSQRPDLIGFVPRVGEWAYKKVEAGDRIVYYSTTKRPEDDSIVEDHLSQQSENQSLSA